jgi:hypothetical protein
MGEGEIRLGDPAEQAAAAEREVERTRERITGIVRELSRRRHAVFDLRAQLRHHGVAVGVAAAALALAIGGAVWLAFWRRARRARPLAKAHRLRLAAARMVAHPDQVARPSPQVGNKVLAAFGSAAAGVLAKALAERLVARPKAATK